MASPKRELAESPEHVRQLAILSPQWTGGGIGRYVSELATALEIQGETVKRLLPPSGIKGNPAQRVKVALQRMSMPPSRHPLIYGHWRTAASVGALVLPPIRRTNLLIVHCAELAPIDRDSLEGAVLRRTLVCASRIVAVSSFTKELLVSRNIPSERIAIIRPGIPADFGGEVSKLDIEKVRKDLRLGARKIALSVSRLVPRKGHQRTLHALARMTARNRPILIIVGEGPTRREIENCVSRLDIAESVRVLGHVPDSVLPTLYKLADVFVMPTDAPVDGSWDMEGFGIAYLEAAACATPSIATNVGGVAEALVDGVTGWLLPADASVDHLADSIGFALRENDMGERARRFVSDRYRWEDSARRYRELLTK